MAKSVTRVELSKCKPGALVEIQTKDEGSKDDTHWVSLVKGWSVKDGVLLGLQLTGSAYTPRSNLPPLKNQAKDLVEVEGEWWYVVLNDYRVTYRVTGIWLH